MKLILDQVLAETELIRVMSFRSASGSALPNYTAGAHIEFDLGSAGKRSYSLIDWPNSSELYTVAVQYEKSGEGGSRAMHELREGQSIETTLPKNDFELIDGLEPILLLAGGIGITPLKSMATKLHQQAREFQLHYTAREASRMGFTDALTETFNSTVSFHLDDKNPLDLTQLMRAQASNTRVYLCGPRGMIDAARSAAIDAGISTDAIHIELFSTPETKNDDSAFEVEISDTGQVITVAADQTIIEALESAGLDVMYDCQRGDCGICQCTVVSGIPDHRDVVLSDDERASGKLMQICVSRAKSARLVIEI
ncbi:PDR/VanB family oxidoreductase [Granulosicoccus sp.]|nr:PDR/VanB family oxidoreductase [Granulosicoccus sp.]